jgi:hypothetical protein
MAVKISKPQGIGNKYIEFTISPEGEVTVRPVGFADGSCVKATESYEKALGVVAERQNTGPDVRQDVSLKTKG